MRTVLIESVLGMNDLDSIRKLFLWKIQLIYQRNQRSSLCNLILHHKYVDPFFVFDFFCDSFFEL